MANMKGFIALMLVALVLASAVQVAGEETSAIPIKTTLGTSTGDASSLSSDGGGERIFSLKAAASFGATSSSVESTTIPQGHSSINIDDEAYQTNLYTGSNVYAIPIFISAGTGGLQPSVWLRYNSLSHGFRGGVLGSGWQ